MRLELLIIVLVAVFAIDLALFDSVGAQQTDGGRGAVMRACSGDLQKLCPDAKGPERRQCLRDNKDKLSEACKSAIETMRQQNGAAGSEGR